MDIRITVTQIPRIRPDAFAFSAGEMQSVGDVALPHERLDRGLNRFDQPMDPLSKGYARRKQRRGRKPVRDLRMTGALRQSITVEAADNRTSIFVGHDQWLKGHFNQLRSQWYGLSPTDAGRVDARVEELHAEHLRRAVVP